MSIDITQPISSGSRPEWDLPKILDIQIRRIPFKPRKLRNFKSVLADHKEVVEFLVYTSAPIPARALGPALFIGDVQVIESQQVGENKYSFLAFDFERIEADAPISWGWINASKEQRESTRFRYKENPVK